MRGSQTNSIKTFYPKFLITLTTFCFLLCVGCVPYNLYIPDENANSYDPNRSTLTIKYRYESGMEAAETVRGNIYAPNHYLIRSPEIPYHTPDKEYVRVTASGENIEIIVTYIKNPAFVIRYIYLR